MTNHKRDHKDGKKRRKESLEARLANPDHKPLQIWDEKRKVWIKSS